MMQQIRLILTKHGGLLHVLPLAHCRPEIFFAGQVGGAIMRHSYLCVCLWDPSFMLQSYGVGWLGWVGWLPMRF